MKRLVPISLALLAACSSSTPGISITLDAAVDTSAADGAADSSADGPGDAGASDLVDGSPADVSTDGTTGIDTATGDVAPLTAARSFVVTGMLDAHAPRWPVPSYITVPDRHDFTLRLDPQAGRMTIGGVGTSITVAMKTTDGVTFQAGPFSTLLPAASGFCDRPQVRYTTFTATVRGDRVEGKAEGEVIILVGDVGDQLEATLTFSGPVDDVPPSLGTDRSDVDPLRALQFLASEPFAAGTTATLMPAAGGGAQPVTLNVLDRQEAGVVGFEKGAVSLGYGAHYRLTVGGPGTDLAGNAFGTGPSVATRAAPSLIAEDGFEGATTGTVGGAMVVDASYLPPIAGQRSLYLPADRTPGIRRFTGRLPVAAGDHTVRFEARAASSSKDYAYSTIAILAAAPAGGPISVPSAPTMMEWGMGVSQSVTLPGGAGFLYLGPVRDVQMPLPAGATSEVIVDISVELPAGACGLVPPTLGLLVDDLRVE